MDKEKMLKIAERNLNKAQRSLSNNIDRSGITEDELENLFASVEYARIVYDLISVHYVDGSIKRFLEDSIAEMCGYIEDTDNGYSDLERHDCRVALEAYKYVLNYVDQQRR